MKLRDIEFGPVLGASGVQGWFGEGYPYHRYAKLAGLNFDGMTLVSKTTTLNAREGDMPVKKDGVTPAKLFPKCVKVKFFKGIALNSVGLTGPGAEALFKMGEWQQLTSPFLFSFMSVAKDKAERRHELKQYCALLKRYELVMRAPFGLQINFSCPNTDLDPTVLIHEVGAALADARMILGEKIPIMPKFNAVTPPEVVKGIQGFCDAVCVSNTIPWGKLPEKIDWKGLWGTQTVYEQLRNPEMGGTTVDRYPVEKLVSPLADLGGGGLSGSPLLPIVADWVREARDIGVNIPINAGGGIMHVNDIRELVRAGIVFGRDSIFLGSVAFLRPWRVRGLIKRAHRLHNIAVPGSDCYVARPNHHPPA
jgi:dihydroorotate dehydrogenase